MFRKFRNYDTRVLENAIDTEIKTRLHKIGIEYIPESKSGLYDLFNILKHKGIKLDLVDCYKKDMYKCEYVCKSPNLMNVVIEDNRYIQCGIEVKL